MLAPFEVCDRLGELGCAQLQLPALLGDELLDRLVAVCRRVKQAAEPVANAVVELALLRPVLPFPVVTRLSRHRSRLSFVIRRSPTGPSKPSNSDGPAGRSRFDAGAGAP